MKIGIVGAGNIGRAYATLWHKAGHQVFLSSRKPQEHQSFVKNLGDGALVGTPVEAAEFGDVIFLAANYASAESALQAIRPHVGGKLVIDAMNPLRAPGDDRKEPLIDEGQISGLVTAGKLPEARIARAFTGLWAGYIEAKSDTASPSVAIPLAVDGEEDRLVVEELVSDAGFVPAYVGGLKQAGALDPGSPVWNVILTKDEALSRARAFNRSRAASLVERDFPTTTRLPAELVNADSVQPLASEESVAVHETVTRVYLAEDSRDPAALKSLVTEDFVQEHIVYGRLQGRDAFADWVVNNPAAFDGYRHMSINIVTSALGENEAQALSYILVVEVHPEAEIQATALPRILGHGVVRDRLVKQAGRWLIAQRTYDQFAVPAAVMGSRDARLRIAQPYGAVLDHPADVSANAPSYDGFETFGVTIADRVARVRFNNAPVNLIDFDLSAELIRALSLMESDDRVGVVVFESADPDFFLAHVDVNMLLAREGKEAPADQAGISIFQELDEAVRNFSKPTIAKIDGVARGGGLELAMSMDMRFGSIENTILAQVEASVGVIPNGGGTIRWPQMIGTGRALELLLGASDFDGLTAERYGLINRAVAADELDAFVDTLARRMASYDAEALRLIKQLVYAKLPDADALNAETRAFRSVAETPETYAALKRFLADGGQTRDVELNGFQ
ncbi:MAG: enoyl-CoA hydratase-related protein [Myxococcota bacterium]